MPVVELAKKVTGYVEEAGKDAPQRRDRLRDVFSIAAATFREELRYTPMHRSESRRRPIASIARSTPSSKCNATPTKPHSSNPGPPMSHEATMCREHACHLPKHRTHFEVPIP